MKVYNDNTKVHIKSWCNNPEDGAIEQAKNLANLPFVYKHVALMSDCHQGYGMPIGGVIACENAIIPNAVGTDVGCGMATVKTSLTSISTERLKEIMTLIRKKIPVGFNRHSKMQDENLMPHLDPENLWPSAYPICSQERKSTLTQLGTLGSGNHFIQISKGSDGYIWIMLHSGSRNLGYQVAKYYNELAIKLNEKWHTVVPKKHELAFLPIDTVEAQAYLREMNYCLEFAKANRALMIQRTKEAFNQVPCNECNAQGGAKGKKCEKCDGDGIIIYNTNVSFEETIDIHHNYVTLENHFGKNVWVHRKGATSAKEGEIGIIPGSQGTNSYIVTGKGNSDSFKSCSHGAGRALGRRQAVRELDLETEKKKLEDKGILHAIRSKDDLEEASGAYKDIDTVMEEQKDLVDIKIKLTPMAVIKG